MPPDMRLLVVTTLNDRSETAILRALATRNVEVDVIGEATAPERPLLEEKGITFYPYPIRHRLDFPAVRAVHRLIQTRKPSLIFAPRNSTLSVSLFAALGLRVPVIGYRGTVGHISRFDPASWLTYLNPRVTRILCVSHAVEKYLQSMGIAQNKLVTIYKGHDPAWYANLLHAPLSEFGIPPRSFTIGFAGNIRPVKGVNVLLDAFAMLPQKPDLRLLIVGEIRQAGILNQIAESPARSRIHLAGFRTDAAGLMGACQTCVMPSLDREGLPRAVIEAMAQGVPPVVSNAGGMPELVEHNCSGLVTPAGNAQSLSHALLDLYINPERRTAIGKAAQQRIEATFHIDKTIDQFHQLCKSVCMHNATLQPDEASP